MDHMHRCAIGGLRAGAFRYRSLGGDEFFYDRLGCRHLVRGERIRDDRETIRFQVSDVPVRAAGVM